MTHNNQHSPTDAQQAAGRSREYDVVPHEVEVAWDAIKKLCPREEAHFQEALSRCGYSLDEFADQYEYWVYGDDLGEGEAEQRAGGDIADVIKAWRALRGAFAAATRAEDDGCLALEVGYRGHWDCHVGAYFTVEGAHRLSLAGKKFKEKLQRKVGALDSAVGRPDRGQKGPRARQRK
jgi:hypothetical protein